MAKEKHQGSEKEQERAEHHHATCYASEKHYWAPIARRSLELGVKLHAAVHDGYSMMYAYIRCPSAKKPLTEIDHSLWHSEDHPQGQLLSKLLDSGFAATRWLRKRTRAGQIAAVDDGARFRAADVFQLAQYARLRTAVELRRRAHEEAANGRPGLAEFCTTHGDEELQQYLDNAWAVHEAPQRAMLAACDRVAKLRHAATQACSCGGVWAPGVRFILAHQREDVPAFCRDVLRALTLGAARGVNMAVVGPPGCGKSTVFEALDIIYKTSAKPERESTFPISGILGAEVLLWQEFAWGPKVCAFEDLLAMLNGEKLAVRVPCARPVQHRNGAPMFYTAWALLTMTCTDRNRMVNMNKAMDERFTIRTWSTPLPLEGRIPRFPQCACCFARFVLEQQGPQ